MLHPGDIVEKVLEKVFSHMTGGAERPRGDQLRGRGGDLLRCRDTCVHQQPGGDDSSLTNIYSCCCCDRYYTILPKTYGTVGAVTHLNHRNETLNRFLQL